MVSLLSPDEEAQLLQTIEMFEVITQSQPQDYQSLEILKEAYFKLGRQKDVILISKRIAKAYVELGQLSSAILEYETILQLNPSDPEALAAMTQIENKANSLADLPNLPDTDFVSRSSPGGAGQAKRSDKTPLPTDIDDGKQAMRKLFVDGKSINAGDFEVCWPLVNLSNPPTKIVEPFIQVLAEKALLPLETSLRLIADRTRLGFLPLERYDIDMEVARSFPKDVCQRWCVVPFDRMSKAVLVATSNPFNKQAAMELERHTQNRLIWYLASPVDLIKLLRKIHR